jgi:hypothetical protein
LTLYVSLSASDSFDSAMPTILYVSLLRPM